MWRLQHKQHIMVVMVGAGVTSISKWTLTVACTVPELLQ
jgi:hypothetical protein